jgi:hypothetical protein
MVNPHRRRSIMNLNTRRGGAPEADSAVREATPSVDRQALDDHWGLFALVGAGLSLAMPALAAARPLGWPLRRAH